MQLCWMIKDVFMKKYTAKELIAEGYKLDNALIKNVSLSYGDYCCLVLDITLEGDGWGCVYGGYCLGNIYPDSYDKDSYEGSAAGMEVIMRIMDIVGVSCLEDMKGKYVRVATKKWGDTVKIIGNIIKDRWFDYGTFFTDEKEESK